MGTTRGAQLLSSQKPNEMFITKFLFLVYDFQSLLPNKWGCSCNGSDTDEP